jgi:hypothetical protein
MLNANGFRASGKRRSNLLFARWRARPVQTISRCGFSYIPSFDPSVFITVQRKGEGFVLIAKQLNGAGGYDPGILARSKEIALTEEQAVEFEAMLAEGGLFREAVETCEFGFDGSRWIFELVSSGEYQMVNLWSPSDGAAHELGELRIRLSGWNIETY